jgi:hypothetical protein
MKKEIRWLDSKYRRNELFSTNSKGVNRWKEGNRLPEGDNHLNNGKIMTAGGAYGKYRSTHEKSLRGAKRQSNPKHYASLLTNTVSN